MSTQGYSRTNKFNSKMKNKVIKEQKIMNTKQLYFLLSIKKQNKRMEVRPHK